MLDRINRMTGLHYRNNRKGDGSPSLMEYPISNTEYSMSKWGALRGRTPIGGRASPRAVKGEALPYHSVGQRPTKRGTPFYKAESLADVLCYLSARLSALILFFRPIRRALPYAMIRKAFSLRVTGWKACPPLHSAFHLDIGHSHAPLAAVAPTGSPVLDIGYSPRAFSLDFVFRPIHRVLPCAVDVPPSGERGSMTCTAYLLGNLVDVPPSGERGSMALHPCLAATRSSQD